MVKSLSSLLMYLTSHSLFSISLLHRCNIGSNRTLLLLSDKIIRSTASMTTSVHPCDRPTACGNSPCHLYVVSFAQPQKFKFSMAKEKDLVMRVSLFGLYYIRIYLLDAYIGCWMI